MPYNPVTLCRDLRRYSWVQSKRLQNRSLSWRPQKARHMEDDSVNSLMGILLSSRPKRSLEIWFAFLSEVCNLLFFDALLRAQTISDLSGHATSIEYWRWGSSSQRGGHVDFCDRVGIRSLVSAITENWWPIITMTGRHEYVECRTQKVLESTIARFAFELAKQDDRKKVTAVHKANIM